MSSASTRLGLLLLVVFSVGLAAAASDDADVTVRRSGDGHYAITATFRVPEPAAVVRDVLTDYAGIPRFMPDVRTSVVRSRGDGQIRVEQEAVSKYLMFSKRVHLLLAIEEGSDRITFRDECGRSFTRYEGVWRITPGGATTLVAYELIASPAFDVPDLLVSRVLTRDAREMVKRLREEFATRARQ